MNIQDMIDAAEAALKHRKPTSNDGRAEYVEDLRADLEEAQSNLSDLAEMVDELLTAIEEVGDAETMAEMRDNGLIDDVRDKATALRDALRDGI